MPSPVYTFSPNGVIRASEFNTNFALLEDCLGLAGGTMTGTINSLNVYPTTTATYALGSITKAYAGVVANALKLTDSNSTHLLSIVTSSNLTADRILTLVPGDAARTVTIAADCTIGGVAGVALGGTGLSATPTNGQLPIGNGTGFTLASLSAGANITITPGAGSISIAAASGTDTTPIGVGGMWFTATVPTGDYEFLRGQAISRATYATLFGLMGTTYGVGDGSTTFNLPDMQQRFPLGKGTSGTGATLGSTGGTIDHTHTATSSGSHVHATTGLSATSNGAHTHTYSATTGAGSAHMHAITVTDTADGANLGAQTYVTSVGDGAGHDTDAESSHTHTAAGTTASDGAHTHPISGNVDSEGAHTHATTTGNPPFLSVNFIIRAK